MFVVRVEVDALVDVLAGWPTKFGMFAVSIVSTQPSRMSRAAIQSVRTTRSQPVSWPASSGGLDRAEELVVVVDRLLVVDLDPVLRRELLERRVLGRVVLVVVDVERPVGEVERRRRAGRSAAARRRGARTAPSVGAADAAAVGLARRRPVVPQAARNAATPARAEPWRKRRRVIAPVEGADRARTSDLLLGRPAPSAVRPVRPARWPAARPRRVGWPGGSTRRSV